MINTAKNTILFFALVLCTMGHTVYAQTKEGNIWYFGRNAGLDFNTTPPTALSNGALNTIEGCATICNKQGNLMFYTNGINVYTKTHVQMANGFGLNGDPSSTQSAVVVQNPDSANIYYVFTTSGYLDFSYSVVDTSANGGLGVVRQKNISLMPRSTEKLNAVKHANGKDTWVITHQSNNNSFRVYAVTGAGVNKTAVVSVIGSVHSGISPGYIKLSPDGTKLVSADYFGKLELFDFDAATGIISNPRELGTLKNYYGVEFSASGRYLYITTAFTTGDELWQFDMYSGSQAALLASLTVIVNFRLITNFVPGALQLAPDGKIYIALYDNSPYLAVINNPEKQGAACNFVLQGIMLSPKSSSWGLPSFNQSYFRQVEFETQPATCGKLTFKINNTGDTGKITLSTWDFGDGTVDTGITVFKTYATHGTYTITNTVTVGPPQNSVTTTKKDIRTFPVPKAGFTINTPLQCLQKNNFLYTDTTKYLYGSTKASSTWVFSDTTYSPVSISSVVRNYYREDSFGVNLIVRTRDGCADTLQKFVHILPSAHAAFEGGQATQCLKGNEFTFKQKAVINSGGSITGYRWLFSDGGTDTTAIPVKKFTDTGTYTIRMASLAANGCNDTITDKVTVFASPVAWFTAASTCSNDSVPFINSSTLSKGTLTYKWEYGDATSDTARQKTKKYADTGLYSVHLTTTSEKGCSDSITKTVRIIPAPRPGFSHSNTCNQNDVQFTDTGRYFGLPAIYKWDLGNGHKSSRQNPVTVYPGYGSYPARLIVQLSNGCTDSTMKVVQVFPIPDAGFSINNPQQCLRENAFEFTDTSVLTPGATIATYQWWVNGTAFPSLPTINTSLLAPGTYPVKLIITTGNDCVDSALATIDVHPQTDMDVSLNDSVQCLKDNLFEVTDNSVVKGGAIATRLWQFSDGPQYTTPLPLPRSFAIAGTYSLRVTVQTSKGCRDSTTLSITVHPSPQLSFSAADICLNETAVFNNTSQDSTITIAQWRWNFGDTRTAALKSPLHRYTSPGLYTVFLYAETDKGCADSIAHTVLVKPIPHAQFTAAYKESIDRLIVYAFTNQSSGAQAYFWDFGNNTYSTDEHPDGIYMDTGHFWAQLVAKNTQQCTDTQRLQLFIKPAYDLYIPNAFTPHTYDTLNDIFRPQGIAYVKEYELHISDRWGEEVFFSDRIYHGWDGTFKGTLLPPGIFIYFMRVKDLENKLHIYKGAIHLLR